ncbi:MAG: hypothetical protein R3F07_07065 [Opitutaceae bacterium]
MKRTFRTGRTVTHALIAATVFLPTLPALTAQDESAPEIIIVQPAEADPTGPPTHPGGARTRPLLKTNRSQLGWP